MTPFFIYFLSSISLWYSFLYLKIVKIHLHRVPLWSILVCKIPEFWRWKLWDQNFVSFNSGNIDIKESKKPNFNFSIKLRTKFVWCHGLLPMITIITFCINWCWTSTNSMVVTTWKVKTLTKRSLFYMRQYIQERTKYNMWKTTFKKFYRVYSSMQCPIYKPQ